MASNNVNEVRVKEGIGLAQLARDSNLSETTIRKVDKLRGNGSPRTQIRLLHGVNKGRMTDHEYTLGELFP